MNPEVRKKAAIWLVLIPLTLGRSPDRTLTPALAVVPVANVAQMIRDAIRGIYLWPLIVETIAMELAMVVLCLLVARFVLRCAPDTHPRIVPQPGDLTSRRRQRSMPS